MLTSEQRKAIEWAIGMASQHNIHNSTLRELLAAATDVKREAWEYSFIHSSSLDRGDTTIGPCLTYDRSIAFGAGCFGQRQVSVCSAAPAEGPETVDEQHAPVLIRCASPVDVEATLWRWKTSWGGWTYRKELPPGWRGIRSIEAYRISSAATAPTMSEAARDVLWRHKKTGGAYRFVAESRMERDPKAVVVTYRNIKTGETWTRPYGEFYDGRFERIDRAAARESGSDE